MQRILKLISICLLDNLIIVVLYHLIYKNLPQKASDIAIKVSLFLYRDLKDVIRNTN